MLIEQLRKMEERFHHLEYTLALPESVSDGAKYSALMKEYSALQETVAQIRAYNETESAMIEAQHMMESEKDPDMRALAEEEYYGLRETLAEMEKALRIAMLPRDPNDEKNVVLEIRAGAGGEEAALFAAVLYRMYIMYAESRGYRCEVVGVNETELGGYREITCLISGSGAYSRFKYESGVHRVQRVPETESSGRIHTSTATVAVLPETEEIQLEINPADIVIDTIKSTGAGGQHINKTESAIRLTHKPSGIVIESQDERSQLRNKEKAMRLLRAKLYDRETRQQQDRIAAERKSQVGSGDRSERIRTYNYPQGRITDHRISLTCYTLPTFLNGNIDEIIDALAAEDAAQRLAEGGILQ